MNTKHLIACLAASGLLLSACSDESATETMSSATGVASASAATSTTTAPAASPTSTPAVEAQQPSTVEPGTLEAGTLESPALPSAPPAAVEANTPIDARSPDEIVAGAGERGQRYSQHCDWRESRRAAWTPPRSSTPTVPATPSPRACRDPRYSQNSRQLATSMPRSRRCRQRESPKSMWRQQKTRTADIRLYPPASYAATT